MSATAERVSDGPAIDLVNVAGGDDLLILKTLFVEYADMFDHQLCFDAFDAELADLPRPYAPPDGGLILAKVDGHAAGCAALKRLNKKSAELKRLFVRPGFRGNKLGMRMTDAMIDLAKSLNYKLLQAETVPTRMGFAVTVYRQFGFETVRRSPDDPIVLMERRL